MTQGAGVDSAEPVSGRRILILYVVLGLALAGVFIFVAGRGHTKHAQPSIAGGYEVTETAACVGPQIEFVQSGRFVSLTDAKSSVGGKLTFKGARLTGSVRCRYGGTRELIAHARRGGVSGTIGRARFAANLRRDPPDPGAPKPLVPASVSGEYQVLPASECFGSKIELSQSGSRVSVVARNVHLGKLGYREGLLVGTIACERRGSAAVKGMASGRNIDLMLSIVGAVATPAARTGAGKASAPPAAPAPVKEHVTAMKTRTLESSVVSFFIVIVVVTLLARLLGSLMPRIGQPRVMGEVLAGICLGPTVLGAIAPSLQAALFPADIVPYVGVVANLGLIFYMFLIGLEVDFSQIRGRVRQTLAISNTALLLPLMMGLLAALLLYPLLGPPTGFLGFALFVSVSMSITAFPVLARIISERRMLKRPLGTVALSAAATDDVSAWLLIALATAVAGGGGAGKVLRTLLLAVVFCLVMAFAVRPLLARAGVARDEAGQVPGGWITAIFAGVLLSAIATDEIGIAVIFGAFAMGAAMPRHAGLTDDVTRRVEDFVLTLLLPLFFAYTGLRTNVGLLGSGQLVVITAGLCAIAIVGKYGGTLIAARVVGMPWRESAVLGALMNTRGLTELIVLNLALSLGVISSALFAALVLMALLTTFMAGPLIRVLDPKNSFGSEPEDEIAESAVVEPERRPDKAILIASQTTSALEQLLSIAEPLARTDRPRELILTRLVQPTRSASVHGGIRTESRMLGLATAEVQELRDRLLVEGIAARGVALTTTDAGKDLTRLSRGDGVELVLMDGRHSLFGEGIPRDQGGEVLAEAPCDVALLIARDEEPVVLGPDASVIVPFGGAEHDWAALELAVGIAAATSTPLQLLGSSYEADGRDASGLLANASLAAQRFAGVEATPLLAAPGRAGVLSAAEEASLLVIGLSDRWRREGLGETRRAIARSACAPVLFVRRGQRSGPMGPAPELTRFGWSSAPAAAAAGEDAPAV